MLQILRVDAGSNFHDVTVVDKLVSVTFYIPVTGTLARTVVDKSCILTLVVAS